LRPGRFPSAFFFAQANVSPASKKRLRQTRDGHFAVSCQDKKIERCASNRGNKQHNYIFTSGHVLFVAVII
jgi:hypothetical protein